MPAARLWTWILILRESRSTELTLRNLGNRPFSHNLVVSGCAVIQDLTASHRA